MMILSMMMPTEERQPIGEVRPTGWDNEKYPGIVDSDLRTIDE